MLLCLCNVRAYGGRLFFVVGKPEVGNEWIMYNG